LLILLFGHNTGCYKPFLLLFSGSGAVVFVVLDESGNSGAKYLHTGASTSETAIFTVF
jgi:hypothetical protein